MSMRAIEWAWRQEGLSTAAIAVLQRLAFFASDRDNECWPSQRRLGEACNLARETVNKIIGELVDAGLIERKQRKNGYGGYSSNLYIVRCDANSHAGKERLRVCDDPCDAEGITPVTTASHKEQVEEPYILESPPTPPAGGDAGFSIWYAIYPHKVGKAAALKAFKAVRKKTPLEALIQGAHKYVATKPPDRPWCNPSTWLNQQRWLDQPAGSTPTEVNGHDISRPTAPPPRAKDVWALDDPLSGHQNRA